MYTFVIFVLAGLAAISQAADEECSKLMQPHFFHCCSRVPMKPNKPKMDAMKECFNGPPKPHSCETHICIAKKIGYGNDDGTFKKDMAEVEFEKEFGSDPELFDAVKKNCINGDLSKYGAEMDCDVHKLKHCIHKQQLLNCKEWENDGVCNGIKDLVEKCLKE